jgi:hypothetical protein
MRRAAFRYLHRRSSYWGGRAIADKMVAGDLLAGVISRTGTFLSINRRHQKSAPLSFERGALMS